ncbi:trithorax group protein osa-like [Octopus bimaculoides]|uniref:Uncharacterized protein n=1 Tax=Octopus bimaculoides TaxID=37653 RepID=A0A0L8GXN8_OCTBM|nr:trithorax group protein osa-like [Octopus bimaculoides]
MSLLIESSESSLEDLNEQRTLDKYGEDQAPARPQPSAPPLNYSDTASTPSPSLVSRPHRRAPMRAKPIDLPEESPKFYTSPPYQPEQTSKKTGMNRPYRPFEVPAFNNRGIGLPKLQPVTMVARPNAQFSPHHFKTSSDVQITNYASNLPFLRSTPSHSKLGFKDLHELQPQYSYDQMTYFPAGQNQRQHYMPSPQSSPVNPKTRFEQFYNRSSECGAPHSVPVPQPASIYGSISMPSLCDIDPLVPVSYVRDPRYAHTQSHFLNRTHNTHLAPGCNQMSASDYSLHNISDNVGFENLLSTPMYGAPQAHRRF